MDRTANPLRSLRRKLREEGGAGYVEFAVVFLVFMLIILGVIDFGRAIYQYNLIANSAREGARIAIVQTAAGGPTDVQVKQRVVDMAVSGLTTSEVTVSGSRTCPGNPCNLVTVSVAHPFTPVTPLISSIIGTITLKVSSSMYVER